MSIASDAWLRMAVCKKADIDNPIITVLMWVDLDSNEPNASKLLASMVRAIPGHVPVDGTPLPNTLQFGPDGSYEEVYFEKSLDYAYYTGPELKEVLRRARAIGYQDNKEDHQLVVAMTNLPEDCVMIRVLMPIFV